MSLHMSIHMSVHTYIRISIHMSIYTCLHSPERSIEGPLSNGTTPTLAAAAVGEADDEWEQLGDFEASATAEQRRHVTESGVADKIEYTTSAQLVQSHGVTAGRLDIGNVYLYFAEVSQAWPKPNISMLSSLGTPRYQRAQGSVGTKEAVVRAVASSPTRESHGFRQHPPL